MHFTAFLVGRKSGSLGGLHRSRLALVSIALFLTTLFLISISILPNRAHAAYSGGDVAYTKEDVMQMISGLSEDPRNFSEANRSEVEAIASAYDSLSDEDKSYLDGNVGADQSQSYGRVLESAIWALWSLQEPDNSTTLSNGIYDANSQPALSSEYSKGKSTSSRQRPWKVQSVTVQDGHAFATIIVESDSYPSMITGGVTYDKTNTQGNCVFENVPIDLNSTFYFAGNSSIMPRPIMFSLTTTIEEPESQDDSIDLSVSCSSSVLNLKGTAKARIVEGQTSEEDTLIVDATLNGDSITKLLSPSLIEGDVADTEARLQEGNTLQIVLMGNGTDSSFENEITVPVKLYLYFADEWLDGQMSLDLSSRTLSFTDIDFDTSVVKKMIEALPDDPMAVTSRHSVEIEMTEQAYNELPEEEQKVIDKSTLGGYKYGRVLEQAVWALRSLKSIDNSTTLKDGVYTGKVKSSCSLGKSESARQFMFTVKKVTVKNGEATALIEHDGTSTDYVCVGGKRYLYVNTDENAKSQFEIPIDLNSTMYLISMAKNPTSKTVGITYTLTTTADESTLKPDKKKPSGDNDDSGDSGDNGSGNGGNEGSGGNGGSGGHSGSGGHGSGSGSGGGNSGMSGSGSSTNNQSVLARVNGSSSSSNNSSSKNSSANGSSSNSKDNSSKQRSSADTKATESSKGNADDSQADRSNDKGSSTLGNSDGSDGLGSVVASPVFLVVGALLALVGGGLVFALGFTRRENGYRSMWAWNL